MRWILRILGGLLVLVGTIWILQGFNILPGSFMTGQLVWARNGALLAIAGVLMLFFGLRPPPPR
jgi:multisubunit Na+/H+ antiporter MnhB subunit